MSKETVTQAVEKRDKSPATLLAQYTTDFANVLPSHLRPQTFVRLAQGVLRRDEKLAKAAEANPASLFTALLDCARLGHEPGTEAYALTWRNIKGTPTVLGIEQYQGVIERMFRAGAVRTVKCEVVRELDGYDFDDKTMDRPIFQPGQHVRDPKTRHRRFLGATDRGEMIGVFAYAVFVDGGISRVVEMSPEEVAKHRAKAATTAIWDEWPEPMWRKTSMHELEKWTPTSAEYRRETLRAIAEADTIRQRPTHEAAQVPQTSADDIADAEIVDDASARDKDDWPAVAKPGAGE